MYKYHEIITIRQNIGDRSLTIAAATSERKAAEIAVQTLHDDIHSSQSREKDGQQAWLVGTIVYPNQVPHPETLTEDEIRGRLEYSDGITFTDVTGERCTLWLSTLRVVEG